MVISPCWNFFLLYHTRHQTSIPAPAIFLPDSGEVFFCQNQAYYISQYHFLREGIFLTAHSQTREAILHTYAVDPSRGLSDTQIQQNRAQYGKNLLREKKKRSAFLRFLDQFKDVMILILLFAAGVSCFVAYREGDPSEFFEPLLILLIVVLNAILGVIQESRAEKALDALKGLSAPHARVLRDGAEKVIAAAELVPGDIIRLEAGDFVPADARLLHSAGLKSEESALTGESVPSDKDADTEMKEDAPLGDRTNMIFSGCSITYGTATAVVTATGMNTEMGKIANLLEDEEQHQTPLQQKLSQLGKYLGIVALAACSVIFAVGLTSGTPPMEIFMIAVSLAVSAIPEGLPVIVTIVLSIGVQRMAKRNALVRRLPAVETLGSASVICSDKTGTLTQNRMTLVTVYVDGSDSPEAISEQNSEAVRQLLTCAALCCNASVTFHDGKEEHIGDPTESAIILAAHKNNLLKSKLNERFPRLAELPFDSDRKLMTTIHQIDNKKIAIVKGAFDMLSVRCVSGNLDAARQMTEQMSEGALRVLAVAYRELSEFSAQLTSESIEQELTFLGLVGMIDPPRPEAKEAVALCRRAGIRP
ncbi:MAG: HAD-IC family P-type ATPase, partial [Oscillospiraceae bacterium]|nr:HAD-IC family P-type ATPase [Oscillospiraceae bacterium]